MPVRGVAVHVSAAAPPTAGGVGPACSLSVS